MKSLLMLSVATLALSGVASATTITCTPQPVSIANGIGSATVTCPGFTASPGMTLSSVVLTLAADYLNGALTGTNDVRVTFTPAAIAGVTWTPSSQFIDVIGGFSSGTQPEMFITASGFTNTSFAGGAVTTVGSSIISGSVFDSTGNVFLTYTQRPSGVPEPATEGLMGAALLGFGILRWRKK